MADPMTLADLEALPLAVDIPTAGRAFGWSPSTSFQRAKEDAFPVPITRVGRRSMVLKRDLLASLAPASSTAAGCSCEERVRRLERTVAELLQVLAGVAAVASVVGGPSSGQAA